MFKFQILIEKYSNEFFKVHLPPLRARKHVRYNEKLVIPLNLDLFGLLKLITYN